MITVDGVLELKNSRVYYLAFIVYWGILLFGYDTGIAGGVVAQPYFQLEFGLLNPDGSKNVERTNQVESTVVSVLQAGAFFGALGSAPVSSRFGRRWTLAAFTFVFAIGAILATAAEDRAHSGLELIYAGRVISGLGIGGISAVAPAFVSECAPKEVRGRVTGVFQVMGALGVMLSYFINFGVSQYITAGPNESPRFLRTTGQTASATLTLAYLRKESPDSESVMREMAEIEAQADEERGLGMWEMIKGRGSRVRFALAAGVFFLQQWSGQNSVGYYSPQIFEAIGFTGTKNSLLASGVYGVVKVLATAVFVFFLVERLGRRLPLLISSLGMGALFLTIGTILKTHPVSTGSYEFNVQNESSYTVDPVPPTMAAKAMAALLYIYVCFYSVGWGPLPWIYVAEIFPTRTRHYGMAVASASQWFWNFVVSKVTPDMMTRLGYGIFFFFGMVNICAMAIFAFFLPETKGRSLEDMDIIFGAITAEERAAHVTARQEERALEDHPENEVATDAMDDSRSSL